MGHHPGGGGVSGEVSWRGRMDGRDGPTTRREKRDGPHRVSMTPLRLPGRLPRPAGRRIARGQRLETARDFHPTHRFIVGFGGVVFFGFFFSRLPARTTSRRTGSTSTTAPRSVSFFPSASSSTAGYRNPCTAGSGRTSSCSMCRRADRKEGDINRPRRSRERASSRRPRRPSTHAPRNGPVIGRTCLYLFGATGANNCSCGSGVSHVL